MYDDSGKGKKEEEEENVQPNVIVEEANWESFPGFTQKEPTEQMFLDSSFFKLPVHLKTKIALSTSIRTRE